MMRRLALTCGTVICKTLNGLVLFSLCIALFALLGHTQLEPYDEQIMDNLVAAAHWQTLLSIIVLLIRDANMFESVHYEITGGVLVVTNVFMLLFLFVPIVPDIGRHLRSLQSRRRGVVAEARPTKPDPSHLKRREEAHSSDRKEADGAGCAWGGHGLSTEGSFCSAGDGVSNSARRARILRRPC